MNVPKKLFILSVIISFFVFSSCESLNKAQFQNTYTNVAGNTPPDARNTMDRLTRNGTTFPTGRQFAAAVSNPGNNATCPIPIIASSSQTPNDSYSGRVCSHYRDFLAAGVNPKALKQALFFYKRNKARFSKQRYISIADYGINSRQKRFFILDMQTGSVQKESVSHGSGSSKYGNPGDPNHDGMLDRCHRSGQSTNPNSRYAMTRGGFFKTGNFYYSSHNKGSWPVVAGSNNNGMRLDGLSPGVNDEARSNGVVMHGARYNTGAVMGRSFGCPAFRPDRAAAVLDQINGGSLYYSYVPQCQTEQGMVDAQLQGWQGMCGH